MKMACGRGGYCTPAKHDHLLKVLKMVMSSGENICVNLAPAGVAEIIID